jgi:hypothetical protein
MGIDTKNLNDTALVLENAEGMSGDDVLRDMSNSRGDVDESGYIDQLRFFSLCCQI